MTIIIFFLIGIQLLGLILFQYSVGLGAVLCFFGVVFTITFLGVCSNNIEKAKNDKHD